MSASRHPSGCCSSSEAAGSDGSLVNSSSCVGVSDAHPNLNEAAEGGCGTRNGGHHHVDHAAETSGGCGGRIHGDAPGSSRCSNESRNSAREEAPHYESCSGSKNHGNAGHASPYCPDKHSPTVTEAHGTCCSSNRHSHHQEFCDGVGGPEKDDCCDDQDSCSCDDSCEYNYHLLYHETIGCKRQSSLVSETWAGGTGLEPTATPKTRLTCARCLKATKETGKAIPISGPSAARTCYCSMTKALGNSVRSLTGLDFAKGCCNVNSRRKKRITNGHQDHSHTPTFGGDAPSDFVVGIPLTSGGGVGHEDSKEKNVEIEKQIVRFLSLSISGMTCSGCADKAAFVLRAIPGVIKGEVRVSFVNGRAELSFLPAIIVDVDKDVVKRLKKLTGFDVVTLLNTETTVDELDGLVVARLREVDHDRVEKLQKALQDIHGILTVGIIDAREVEINYDPDETGIRTILSELHSSNGGAFEVELTEVPDEDTVAHKAEEQHLRTHFFQALLVWLLTIPVAVLVYTGDHMVPRDWVRHVIECICASLIIVLAHKIYFNAARTMVYGGAGSLGARVDMDTLVALATLSAYGFSLVVFIMHVTGPSVDSFAESEPFFETSSLLTALILTGRWATGLIRWIAMKKVHALGGSNLQEREVLHIERRGTDPTNMDARHLHHGDILAARKGMKVATDGIVTAGEAELDESHLTGEAKPQKRIVGSYLLAGSTVVAGEVDYRVTKLLQENTLAAIKGMVTGASRQKPQTQETADKVAAYLTPSILVIACVVFLVWVLIGGLAQHRSWTWSSVTAATYAVATLAISCPCAIGLAVPMVLVIASYIGVTRGGFVFKNTAAIEKGWGVTDVIFDKTGTLTTGQLDVVFSKVLVDTKWTDEVPEAVRALIGGLCRSSSHPVSRGMFRFSGIQTPTSSSISLSNVPFEITSMVSNGLEATVDGSIIRGGAPSFTCPDDTQHPQLKYLLGTNFTLFTLSRNLKLFAVFGLSDRIRPEVPAVLQELRRQGIGLYIFSGDHPTAVLSVAKELGIPAENVRAGCKPEEKAAALDFIRTSSALLRTVAFIGDGTNDAVALMAADIGISLSKSTELAANSADIAILKDSLEGIIGFLKLCRRVRVCVYANFGWAVVWNFVAILGACGALVKFRITPEWAGLGELVSVTPIFLISACVGLGFRTKQLGNS